MNMDKNKEKYLNSLYNSLGNNISEDDQSYMNEDSRKLQELLLRIEISPEVEEVAQSSKKEILDKINKRIDHHQRKRILLRVAAVAASVLVIFSSLLFLISQDEISQNKYALSILESVETDGSEVSIISGSNQKIVDKGATIVQTESGDILLGEDNKMKSEEIETEYITVIVPKGRRMPIQFSDGSKAYINSGSKLLYPKEFDRKERKVFLDGEMYVEVEKNKNRPFIIQTKDLAVNVLGTTFNINTYSDDDNKSVVLVEGLVEVVLDDKKTKIYPNQGFFTDGNTLDILPVDVNHYICWKDGGLMLKGDPFDVLLKKLSRYYGTNIVIDDKELNSLVFDGSLNLKNSLEEILDGLQHSKLFECYKIQDTIHIRKGEVK